MIARKATAKPITQEETNDDSARPFSISGKRKGKQNKRPMMARCFLLLGFLCCYMTALSRLSVDPIDSHDSAGNSNLISDTQPNQQEVERSHNRNDNIDNDKSIKGSSPSNMNAGFIHIGKTGGSTISLLLRNGCHSFVRDKDGKPCRVVTNETTTSKLVQAYYHVPDFHKLPKSKHQIYIITTRDVFDRTVSAFLYTHPKNIPFYDIGTTSQQRIDFEKIAYACFPTLEAFAASLKRGNSTECNYPFAHNEIDNTDCSELACATIHGRVRPFNHLFFNFRNIYDKIPSQPMPKRLFVIRKEHLWKDWFTIDDILGNELDPHHLKSWEHNEQRLPSAPSERNVTGIKLPVTRDITDARRQKLCKALEPEYRVYFQILQRAENIGGNDIENAKQIAKQNCPNLYFDSMINEGN